MFHSLVMAILCEEEELKRYNKKITKQLTSSPEDVKDIGDYLEKQIADKTRELNALRETWQSVSFNGIEQLHQIKTADKALIWMTKQRQKMRAGEPNLSEKEKTGLQRKLEECKARVEANLKEKWARLKETP